LRILTPRYSTSSPFPRAGKGRHLLPYGSFYVCRPACTRFPGYQPISRLPALAPPHLCSYPGAQRPWCVNYRPHNASRYFSHLQHRWALLYLGKTDAHPVALHSVHLVSTTTICGLSPVSNVTTSTYTGLAARCTTTAAREHLTRANTPTVAPYFLPRCGCVRLYAARLRCTGLVGRFRPARVPEKRSAIHLLYTFPVRCRLP